MTEAASPNLPVAARKNLSYDDILYPLSENSGDLGEASLAQDQTWLLLPSYAVLILNTRRHRAYILKIEIRA